MPDPRHSDPPNPDPCGISRIRCGPESGFGSVPILTVNDSDGLEATDVLDRPIAKTMPAERRVLWPLKCANDEILRRALQFSQSQSTLPPRSTASNYT